MHEFVGSGQHALMGADQGQGWQGVGEGRETEGSWGADGWGAYQAGGLPQSMS